MPSGAVLEGRGSPLQPKSAGLSGITRQRVGSSSASSFNGEDYKNDLAAQHI